MAVRSAAEARPPKLSCSSCMGGVQPVGLQFSGKASLPAQRGRSYTSLVHCYAHSGHLMLSRAEHLTAATTQRFALPKQWPDLLCQDSGCPLRNQCFHQRQLALHLVIPDRTPLGVVSDPAQRGHGMQ
ncbi:hypothetical protein ABPG77_008977 [Micractinium sp. CCAP 211/92]